MTAVEETGAERSVPRNADRQRRLVRVRDWLHRNRIDAIAVALIIVGSFTVVALHVGAYTELEPDELAHVNGIVKWGRFDVIRSGDHVGQEAMREQACRGIDQRTEPLPPCDSARFDPNDFQDLGQSHIATPVYFVTTGLSARALRATGLVGSIVTAARLLGAIWLAAALVCIWFAAKELRITPAAAAVGIGLVATTPLTLHASAVVNPDATLLLGGAAILWTALRWERGASPWWLLAVVTAIAVITEPTVLLAVGLVALFLGLRALTSPSERRRLLVGAGAVVLIAVVAALTVPNFWRDVVGSTRETVREPTRAQVENLHQATEVTHGAPSLDVVWDQLDRLITPLREAYVPAFLAKLPVTVTLQLTDWLLIGAAFAAVVAASRGSPLVALGVAALVMMLSGPLVELDIYRKYDVNFAVNARYGLPIVPALALLAAWCATRRLGVLVASGALATFSFGAFVWACATI